MFENERIVCEFLRKIAPSRKWKYLAEVEHYWIGELCDELNKQLNTENAKLRSICAEVAGILFNLDVDRCGLCQRDSINYPCPVHTVKGGECLIKSELRELGIEVTGK